AVLGADGAGAGLRRCAAAARLAHVHRRRDGCDLGVRAARAPRRCVPLSARVSAAVGGRAELRDSRGAASPIAAASVRARADEMAVTAKRRERLGCVSAAACGGLRAARTAMAST